LINNEKGCSSFNLGRQLKQHTETVRDKRDNLMMACVSAEAVMKDMPDNTPRAVKVERFAFKKSRQDGDPSP